MKKKVKSIYVLRKFVLASSAKEALRLDANTEVTDVFVQEVSLLPKLEEMSTNAKQAGFQKKD